MVKEIIQAIQEAEKQTSGEIRVHLKRRCGEDVLAEAKKTFRKLRMDHTARRNGVLIFVAPGSKRFAIYGDEGIHQKVGDAFWNETRDKIGACFSKGLIKEGIIAGIESVGEKLKTYFPSKDGKNELSNEVTED